MDLYISYFGRLGQSLSLETVFFFGSFGLYIAAFLAFTFGGVFSRVVINRWGRRFCFAGVILGSIGLGHRWYTAGHPPLSNMYESMYTFATMFVWILLFFTRKESFPLVEGGASVLAILMTGIASVFGKEVRPLVPALQSYWLHLHVSLAFVGEACFAFAFVTSYLLCLRELLLSQFGEKGERGPFVLAPLAGWAARLVVYGVPIGFLVLLGFVLPRMEDQRKYTMLLYGVFIPALFATFLGLVLRLHRPTARKVITVWLPESERLDEFSYKAISLGYPLFVVGAIIFGMVWANKAWGRYWGWDPKETWALITFLVYSGYLHVRLTKGWKGVPTAILSITGFLVTVFTLFGVNYLLAGLHSYGAF